LSATPPDRSAGWALRLLKVLASGAGQGVG
jgi:hypothetical protein